MAGFFGEGGQPPVPLPVQNAGQFTLLWIFIQISHGTENTGTRVQRDEGGAEEAEAPENRQRARRVQPAPG
ncbi:hypothetical protein L3067_02710 [Xanthomonas sp. PPL568]|uniref:hypothetical protein n=1 Tax=Xanthomonas indica TaxID=2912242 RepID=UPI001F5903F4|nr:hypothetical protein [Xanthomonas indica]MCI2243523.1 hypothetical protein [Xanthomonas indica]